MVVENRVLRGDGQVRWTQWVNHAVFDEQGRRLELQATGRDITEQRQDGEAAAWLAAVVASADDAVISKTLDGIVTSWNRGAELLFGYSAAEAVGRSITLIIPPDRLPEEQDILARLRRGQAIDHFETERMTKDGRLVLISLSVSPVRDAHGRVIGASKIARDNSEKRRARQRSEASARSRRSTPGGADRAPAAAGGGGRWHPGDPCRWRAQRASLLAFDDAGVMRFCRGRASDGYRMARRRAFVSDARGARPAAAPWWVTRKGAGARGVPADDPRRRHPRWDSFRSCTWTPARKFMLYRQPHRVQPEELRLSTVAQHVSFGPARVEIEEATSACCGESRRAARGGRRAQGGRARRGKARVPPCSPTSCATRSP